ncbi:MAG: hypothetical protein M1376_10325 [Planctomycetes bacterium]|nr:hypothetical protein [Planctomycetota bacterium]
MTADMRELPLFTQTQPALARGNDPNTSRAASAWFRRTGRLARQQRAVYHALCEHPGATARELALVLGCTDVNIPARRLPVLEEMAFVKRGPKRRCQVTQMYVQTWCPVGQGCGTVAGQPSTASAARPAEPRPASILTPEQRRKLLEQLADKGDAAAMRLLQARHAEGGGGAK